MCLLILGVRVGNKWKVKEVLLKIQVLFTSIRPVIFI